MRPPIYEFTGVTIYFSYLLGADWTWNFDEVCSTERVRLIFYFLYLEFIFLPLQISTSWDKFLFLQL